MIPKSAILYVKTFFAQDEIRWSCKIFIDGLTWKKHYGSVNNQWEQAAIFLISQNWEELKDCKSRKDLLSNNVYFYVDSVVEVKSFDDL